MQDRVSPTSRDEGDEPFVLKATFQYPLYDSSLDIGRKLSTERRRPPADAVATLALVGWLRDGSLEAVRALRPDLVPWSKSADPAFARAMHDAVETVFCNQFAAAFLKMYATDIFQKSGWTVVFDRAKAETDGHAIHLQARARVRRHRSNKPQYQEASDPGESRKPKSKRPRFLSLPFLVTIGLAAAPTAASAIEQYPKLRAGAVSMIEDIGQLTIKLQQLTIDSVEIFAKLLHMGPSSVTFEPEVPLDGHDKM